MHWQPIEKINTLIDNDSYKLLKPVIITAIFMAIVISFFPIRYDDNDDFGIIKTLTSLSGFTPYAHNLFLSQTLTYILFYLYNWWPSFPWYGLFIITAAFLGTAMTLSVLIRSSRQKSIILALPFLVVSFFHYFAYVSFTSASLILELAVFLSLLDWAIKEKCPWNNNKLYGLFLAGCFLFSFLLRWRLVLFSTTFALPILLWVKWREVRLALPLIIILFTVICLDRGLFYVMSPDTMKPYVEYNKIRAKFHDYAEGNFYPEVTQKAATKAGWSLEDYFCFKAWLMLYDNVLFNSHSLQSFLKENIPNDSHYFKTRIMDPIKSALWSSLRHIVIFLSVMLMIPLYILSRFKYSSIHCKKKILLSLGIILTGIVYLMTSRYVANIYVPLFLYAFCAFFLMIHVKSNFPETHGNTISRNRPITFIIIIFLVFAVWGDYQQIKIASKRLEKSEEAKVRIIESMEALKRHSLSKNNIAAPLLVAMNPTDNLCTKCINPLKEFSDYTDIRLFPGGWQINSGHYHLALKEMGIRDGREFLKWMINNNEVFIAHVFRNQKVFEFLRDMWLSYYDRHNIAGQEGQIWFDPALISNGVIYFNLKFKGASPQEQIAN